MSRVKNAVIIIVILITCLVQIRQFAFVNQDHNKSSCPKESSLAQQPKLSYYPSTESQQSALKYENFNDDIMDDIDLEKINSKFTRNFKIPIKQLVQTDKTKIGNENMTCSDGLVLVRDKFVTKSITHQQRYIPKIIHMTSKSRCVTPVFYENIQKWRNFDNFTFVFHDDDAVHQLIDKMAKHDFHALHRLSGCISSGAGIADLWRYLVLWEYGGIYADIDSAPGPRLHQGNAIFPTDESVFVIERLGILSQYFMASAPHHALMHITILETIRRLFNVEAIQKQYAPYVTGPGALKYGFVQFMKSVDPTGNYTIVHRGSYKGLDNQTITVLGARGHSRQFVIREQVNVQNKGSSYTAMNMTHFSRSHTKNNNDKSCLLELYTKWKKEQQQ